LLHTCNPSTEEAETGERDVYEKNRLDSKFHRAPQKDMKSWKGVCMYVCVRGRKGGREGEGNRGEKGRE
jgi:hypothetical protein